VHEVVAEVWRSGFLESVHHGSVIALAGRGRVALSVGQPENVMFPRSSKKPVQVLAMLRNGLDLPPELLALACASHSGEDFHVAGVRRILATAGLTEQALRCTPDLPIGEAAQRAHLAAGRGPAPIFMNCSGKHAAMLATCVARGWSTEDYLDPGHPLQRAIADTLAELAGEPVGAVAKDGAEGVYAVGLPDGAAVAVKIADGADRARTVVLVAALARLVDVTPLAELAEAPVLGHGRPVGAVRPVLAPPPGRV
jgi:L-asparaginase II